jgi:hypothetical protein
MMGCDDPNQEPGDHPGHDDRGRRQRESLDRADVGAHQDRRDERQQHRENPVQGRRPDPGGPGRPCPRAHQAPRQQLRCDGPMRRKRRPRHRDQPGGQRGQHDDQAQRLIDDDRLQRDEPEQRDQQRMATAGNDLGPPIFRAGT